VFDWIGVVYFLNVFEMVPVAPIITDTTFILHYYYYLLTYLLYGAGSFLKS